MKLSSVEQAEQAKFLLLHELREQQVPISLHKLDRKGKFQFSSRTLKEAAWRLVEEGKAKFNAAWDLEASDDAG